MATKRTKSVGSTDRAYFEKASLMCPYPVNIAEGTIDIPQDELETNDLVVAHLVSLGFKVQSCIPGSVTKKTPFNPSLILTPRVVERARSEFLVGDAFKVTSSAEVLTITHIERGKIHLAYGAPEHPLGRQKPPLLVSEDQLKKVLDRELWKRL